MKNSYISLNNHYYSVPKEYIGDTVELLYDGDTVEIYHKFRHIRHIAGMIHLSHIQKNLPINFPEYYMNTESEWMMYTARHVKSIR